MSTDVEDSLILHPLPGDLLRAATAVVCTQPDADLLLDMLGLGGGWRHEDRFPILRGRRVGPCRRSRRHRMSEQPDYFIVGPRFPLTGARGGSLQGWRAGRVTEKGAARERTADPCGLRGDDE